jgi:hypothetical protein
MGSLLLLPEIQDTNDRGRGALVVCVVEGVERRFRGLLGANSTSTALASALEIVAPKLGTNGAKVGSADPGLFGRHL